MSGPLTGLSSRATRHLLADLADVLRERHDVTVHFSSSGGVAVAREVRQGQRADLLVLAEEAMTGLDDEGLLVRGSLRPLFVSQVVLAVPSSAPVPVVDTVEDLIDTLRGARGIAYSTGPSGAALLRHLEDWGLTDELAGRLVQAPPGTPVGSLLAEGRADVGVQQRSELTGIPGVRVVGPLPGAAAATSTFSGAVLASSEHQERADRALSLLGSAEVAPLVEAHGMRPARR